MRDNPELSYEEAVVRLTEHSFRSSKYWDGNTELSKEAKDDLLNSFGKDADYLYLSTVRDCKEVKVPIGGVGVDRLRGAQSEAAIIDDATTFDKDGRLKRAMFDEALDMLDAPAEALSTAFAAEQRKQLVAEEKVTAAQPPESPKLAAQNLSLTWQVMSGARNAYMLAGYESLGFGNAVYVELEDDGDVVVRGLGKPLTLRAVSPTTPHQALLWAEPYVKAWLPPTLATAAAATGAAPNALAGTPTGRKG